MKHVYRLYAYDVWGNSEDGFNVNDTFRTTETVELSLSDDENQILKALVAGDVIEAREDFEIDASNEETIFLTSTVDGMPVGELRIEN